MGIDQRSGFIGLVTNTADLQAPPGALEKAKNVVIRRAGTCETRPGVAPWVTLANTLPTIKIIPYELETVLAAAGEWWNVLGNIAILYPPPDGTATLAPPLFRNDLIPHAQTRGNLYIGTGLGVVKFNGVPDSITGNDMFITAGVPLLMNVIPAGTTGTGWLANNNQVAYVAVQVKTDANGLTTRSRPSGAVYVINTSGGPANTQLQIVFPWPSRLFDTIELYRTRAFPTSVTPDQEYQLVASVAVTASPISILDTTPDNQRGATLYTSPSREGAEGANDLPPACGALAVFKGALFCGNTIGPARAVFSYKFSPTNLDGIATGIGQRLYTGTLTAGSPTMTALSSTVGLERGMVVTSGIGLGGAPWITNISGATITLSHNAAGSNTGTYAFTDGLSVDGGATWRSLGGLIFGSTYGGPFNLIIYQIKPPVGGYTNTVVIESLMPGAASTLAINATHGGEYSPPLPVYGAPSYAGKKDIEPNGLHWSKPDEPEHFPPVNFAFVGDKKRAILGLVSTRDAMYIFKEDGIWRLTGVDGQYRIDPFDLTTRCVLPGSIAPLKNRIFMLSNRGVVAVSDQGVEVVSTTIDDQLKKLIFDLDVAGSGAGYFIQNVGYAGTSSERDNEYLLLLGNALSLQRSGVANGGLVYNEVTRAWVSLECDSSGALAWLPTTWAAHERRGYVTIAQRAPAFTSYAKIAEPGYTQAPLATLRVANDGFISITISAIVGDLITYAPATALVVGDVVMRGGTVSRVTAVTDTTHVTVDPPVATTGAAFAFRPIYATVRPRAWMAPNQVIKLWTQLVAEFTTLVGLVDSTFSCVSSESAATNSLVTTKLPLVTDVSNTTKYYQGAALRGWLPTVAARGFRLIAEVRWAAVYGDAILESIFVETRDGKTNAPNLAVKL